ncbi:MAG TPA: hypothetical protein VHS59_11190 [Bacillota bacterium]|nr:hypothetical protein [Bacillota bacterium]
MDHYVRKMLLLVVCAIGLSIPAVKQVNETFNQIVQPPNKPELIQAEALLDETVFIREQVNVVLDKADLVSEQAVYIREKAGLIQEKAGQLKEKARLLQEKASPIEEKAALVMDEAQLTREKVRAWWQNVWDGQWESIATRKQEKPRK